MELNFPETQCSKNKLHQTEHPLTISDMVWNVKIDFYFENRLERTHRDECDDILALFHYYHEKSNQFTESRHTESHSVWRFDYGPGHFTIITLSLKH